MNIIKVNNNLKAYIDFKSRVSHRINFMIYISSEDELVKTFYDTKLESLGYAIIFDNNNIDYNIVFIHSRDTQHYYYRRCNMDSEVDLNIYACERKHLVSWLKRCSKELSNKVSQVLKN